MKHLIQKTTEPGQSIDNEKFQQALLEYRNCPKENGFSPAQVVFGRALRSCVPAHRISYDVK